MGLWGLGQSFMTVDRWVKIHTCYLYLVPLSYLHVVLYRTVIWYLSVCRYR